MIEQEWQQAPGRSAMRSRMADCAAAPALFYANKVMPFGETHPNAAPIWTG